MTKTRTAQSGFALPSVMIASVVMLIVLVAAATSVAATRSALNVQYYNQLAREAADSGILHAQECIFANNMASTWGDAGNKKLRPGLSCAGGWQCSSANCYIVRNDKIRTTYEIGSPTTSPDGSTDVAVTGKTELLRPGSGTVWDTYTYAQNTIVRFRTTPQIGSGAGWKTGGHNGYMLSGEGTLWGWGDNGSGRLGSTSLGSTVSSPVRIPMPSGMAYVERFAGSGQGASFLCALMVPQSTDASKSVYCRGTGMGMLDYHGWKPIRLPSVPIQYPVDVSVNGYGADNTCVLTNIGNVYCIGADDTGVFGRRTTETGFTSISDQAVRFQLSGSLKAKEVFVQDRHACVIGTNNKAYCAGDNFLGQLGRGNTNTNVWIGNSNPDRVQMPGNLNVRTMRSSYHSGSYATYFLGSDGGVYMAGSARYGTANSGSTSGSYSTPRLLTASKFGNIISIGQEGTDAKGSLCAIRETATGTDSGLFCMGDTKYGQLGRGVCGEDANQPSWGSSSVSMPAGASRISPDTGHTADYQMNSVMVIDKDGNAYAAGDNTYGKLGTGADYQPCNSSFKKVKMPAGVKAVELANGDEYSAFILGDDSNLYAMGRNNQGQLGNGTTNDSNVPVRVLIPREFNLYY